MRNPFRHAPRTAFAPGTTITTEALNPLPTATATRRRPRRDNLNDRIAALATRVFGTMWMTYAFAIYGVLGAIITAWQPVLLYWSNWVQLWSLPLIMVGTAVLGRAAVRQAQETHDSVIEELALVRDELGLVRQQHGLLVAVAAQLGVTQVDPEPGVPE